jgi:Plasmid recombination enzyme
MLERTQVLRIKTLNRKTYGGKIIAVASRHNFREAQDEIRTNSHIDSSKTYLNIVLRGEATAAGVAGEAVKLMTQANIKPLRKNAVLGIEAIVSLPPASGIDECAFFNAAVVWAEGYFELPILSAVIHNDEAAPHCHIIMLPLFDGRMLGNKVMGSKPRMLALQADFFDKVGQPFGLARQVPQKRLSGVARAKAAVLVIDCLVKTPKNLNEPTFRDALLDALTVNPMPLMVWLGFDMPENNNKTAKQFKPKTPIVVQAKTAIAVSAKNTQPLSCVVVLDSARIIEPPKALLEDDQIEKYSRVRDTELPSSCWDSEQGELIKPKINIKQKSAELERMKGVIQAIRI